MKYCRILWFILWILSLVGISHYGGAASYGLFFALTILPLVSLIYLITAYFQFKIYQELSSTDVVCGQPVPYSLVLRNEGFLGISCIRLKLFSNFSYVEDIAENTEYALLPGDEFRYETTLTCRYRGEYNVGIQQVILVDFFKLFCFRYNLSKKLQVMVYPRLAELVSVAETTQLSTSIQHESTSIHKEPDVVVRDYIRGDSLKRIHWKNTARTGRLQVRNDIDEAKQEVTLLFDTGRFGKSMSEYLPSESRILEVSLSLSRFFMKQNARLTIYYGENGLQKQTIQNTQGFEAAYAQISKVSFNPSEHFATLFEECFQKGLFLNTKLLIAVFHEPDDVILRIAGALSVSGTAVLLYAVTDEDINKYAAETSHGCNILALPTEAEWEGLV